MSAHRRKPLAPAPPPSSEVARLTMVANRSVDTRPEVLLRSALHRRGLRFRKHAKIAELGGRARVDIVFPRHRVAVFVDGCFWHGCPAHMTWPKANADWWREKILRNRDRDQETDERLRTAGWRVIRVWEHEPIAIAAERIAVEIAGSHDTDVAR